MLQSEIQTQFEMGKVEEQIERNVSRIGKGFAPTINIEWSLEQTQDVFHDFSPVAVYKFWDLLDNFWAGQNFVIAKRFVVVTSESVWRNVSVVKGLKNVL